MDNKETTIEQWGNTLKGKKLEIKSMLNNVSNYVQNWKYPAIIIWCIAILTTVCMWYFIAKTILDTKELNSKAENLYDLKNYDTSIISSNNYTKNETNNLKKINELIDYNMDLQQDNENYIKNLQGIQAPYDNFLKHLLLPSLNIWKDTYLWTFNDDYIGIKFLENNPYNDTNLLDKRSNFIKDVWANNEYNQIENIEISEIVEEWDEFYIPIKVEFISNSYRSFLLLIEKLSVTSNKESISLINELMYNIREVIKVERKSEISAIMDEHSNFSEDEAIGYNLYNRVKGKSEYSLINDDIINQAIAKIAQCWNESLEYCYYKFRNRYRNIPSLAYSIWLEWNWDHAESFKDFLQNMPQTIKITDFIYDGEVEWDKDMTNFTTKQYKWTIEFKLYWEGIHNDEIIEIQKLLWEKCIGKDLTPETALQQIESKIINLWNSVSVDSYSTTRLVEIQTLIWNISKDFDTLGNYKKVIKTFEMYRMLNEWNVCNK